ncbi:hypothetical protein FOA52_002051 [Chlamydomonas sp. UWO 241]|nr:hypothetical protein FOA52_002051 [Chlamydomonas sp. UWO 241]
MDGAHARAARSSPGGNAHSGLIQLLTASSLPTGPLPSVAEHAPSVMAHAEHVELELELSAAGSEAGSEQPPWADDAVVADDHGASGQWQHRTPASSMPSLLPVPTAPSREMLQSRGGVASLVAAAAEEWQQRRNDAQEEALQATAQAAQVAAQAEPPGPDGLSLLRAEMGALKHQLSRQPPQRLGAEELGPVHPSLQNFGRGRLTLATLAHQPSGGSASGAHMGAATLRPPCSSTSSMPHLGSQHFCFTSRHNSTDYSPYMVPRDSGGSAGTPRGTIGSGLLSLFTTRERSGITSTSTVAHGNCVGSPTTTAGLVSPPAAISRVNSRDHHRHSTGRFTPGQRFSTHDLAFAPPPPHAHAPPSPPPVQADEASAAGATAAAAHGAPRRSRPWGTGWLCLPCMPSAVRSPRRGRRWGEGGSRQAAAEQPPSSRARAPKPLS